MRQLQMKRLKVKGHLSDLGGNALLMAAQGNFIYLMLIHEDSYYTPVNPTAWIQVWMAPATGVHMNQYKEMIAATRELEKYRKEKRGDRFNQKIYNQIQTLVSKYLKEGNWIPLNIPIENYISNFKRNMYQYVYSKDVSIKRSWKEKWIAPDKADQTRYYSPILYKYFELLEEIVRNYGANPYRIVNFINYQLMPVDFWKQYFRRIRNIK